MTGKRLSAILALLALLGAHAPLRAYTIQYRDNLGLVARRWLTQPIIISLSTSLTSPQPNIRTGSDVVGAARRALRRWASVSNVQFFEASSDRQAISPQSGGDHVNLITVSADNSSAFASEDNPGRTRVFSDASGAITEADIALNPNVFFSTDGTFGTYDLESTFTHEIGHLLGLEHSGLVSATMQPRQGTNGTFDLPNFTTRTLSSDDVAGIRSIYGPRSGLGSIAGRVTFHSTGGSAAFGAHVFAEDVSTGRVVAGNIALANGNYRIDNLPPGTYRVVAERLDEPVNAGEIASRSGGYQGLSLTSTAPFLTIEIATLAVAADSTLALDVVVPGGTTA